MRYLSFDVSDATDGVITAEALASTQAEQHAAVLAEVQEVLAWARQRFAHGEGPLDEGHEWDHDLQVHVESGGWHTVVLTLTGSAQFIEALGAAFGFDDA